MSIFFVVLFKNCNCCVVLRLLFGYLTIASHVFLFDNTTNLRLETHIQHTIGLIQHQIPVQYSLQLDKKKNEHTIDNQHTTQY
jgi:hypothetical protein